MSVFHGSKDQGLRTLLLALMYLFHAFLLSGWLITSINSQINDAELCRYLAISDVEDPYPETYVFSSETYTLAMPVTSKVASTEGYLNITPPTSIPSNENVAHSSLSTPMSSSTQSTTVSDQTFISSPPIEGILSSTRVLPRPLSPSIITNPLPNSSSAAIPPPPLSSSTTPGLLSSSPTIYSFPKAASVSSIRSSTSLPVSFSNSASVQSGTSRTFNTFKTSSISPSPTTLSSSAMAKSSSTTFSQVTSTSTASQAISTDGTCGILFNCNGSQFGECCSSYGWCGNDVAHCGPGCNPVGGLCGFNSSSSYSSSSSSFKAAISSTQLKSSSTTSSKTTSTSAASQAMSTDGTCGALFTCNGSQFGLCCSSFGWCGTDLAHCGSGCNTVGGLCGTTLIPSATPPSSTSKLPSSTSTSVIAPTCVPIADACDPGTSFNSGQVTYGQTYYGCGYTESYSNPGNVVNYPPIIMRYPSMQNACTALANCMEWSFNSPGTYDSIDLHLVQLPDNTEIWECVAFFGIVSSGYFTVGNSSILVAYGYDATI